MDYAVVYRGRRRRETGQCQPLTKAKPDVPEVQAMQGEASSDGVWGYSVAVSGRISGEKQADVNPW